MRRLMLALALVALAGCATVEPIRGRLHYGMDDAPEGQKLLWPAAPEVPRFLYTGTLTGEPNFRAEGGPRPALARLGRWLAGLDDQGTPPLVLQRPSALIGDDAGRLYVADISRQAVFVFDEKAGELLLWEQADARRRFVAPAGVALAPGRVFVSDAELGAVFALDAQGAPRGTIGAGRLARPTGVVHDAATGRLFVADTYGHDIKVFDDAGALLATIGQRGSAPGEFNYPSFLALAGGELYVTDTLNNRVQVLRASDGRFVRQFGSRGLALGQLVRPKGVSVDAEGNVYVIESFYDSLLVYSPQGEFLMPIGGTGKATGRFYLPAGVWVDGRNRVHVADMFNGRVVLFQFLGGG
ncbi:MAG TPA: 6-bladed beta-propeller [Burkholderiaceae bacterium]|nr:6-bladed beta-propeller [Burkholderiaceae bacterium]